MKKKYIIIALFIIFIKINLFAEVILYLYPKVEKNQGKVKLSDIASIESDNVNINFSKLEIFKETYSDGFIDRKEILDLCYIKYKISPIIFGSAVRIVEKLNIKTSNKKKFLFTIKKGDKVKLIVLHNGIRIEMIGIAIKNGVKGEIIPVKIRNSKRVMGEIISEKEVKVII